MDEKWKVSLIVYRQGPGAWWVRRLVPSWVYRRIGRKVTAELTREEIGRLAGAMVKGMR